MRRYFYAFTVFLFTVALVLPGNTLAQQNTQPTKINTATFTDLRPQSETALSSDSDLSSQSDNREQPAALAGSPFIKQNGRTDVVIELSDPSVIETFTRIQARESLAQATSAAKVQLTRIDRAQQRMVSTLQKVDPALTVIYRVQRVYNGIAAKVDANKLTQIAKLPGVKGIYPLLPKYLDHTVSVPLIGAPQVWNAASFGATGDNIKIGIIDSGIDYVHTNFGGPGPAGYAANNTLVITDTFNGNSLFPNAKVVGGYDFVGDNYNAAVPATSTPQPDPDPMDCNGHGTHVAGTAAGQGVNSDGTSYNGPYSSTINFDNFRIGPGVAPQADLYALRVFGCTGSTGVTDRAIEWATDPNGDGDFSDRLDVINMSLGSAFGDAYDISAVASDRAAELGVVVVASAGNSSDVYYITGSPGASSRALSVASSVDELDVVDGFQVNSPAGIAGLKVASFSSNFNWTASAPLTATLVYTSTFTGCSAANAAQQALINGNVVLVDWAPAGSSNFFCGSAVRANNAQAAGAVGIIMASGVPSFDTAIAGNTGIRAVYTTFTVGSELKTGLASGPVSVTFSNAFRNAGRFLTPGANDTLSNFSSRGPRRTDSFLKPDIAAPGQSIFSAATGTGNLGRSLNGTSMAAPHVAGTMALLRQLNPNWTVEELKALAMNTATNDLFTGLNQTGNRFGPGRIGTGRVDVPDAATSKVVAYNATNPGLVSVSFGNVEVLPGGVTTASKQIRIANKGNSAASYNLSYNPRVTMAGVSYSLSSNSVTVPANSSIVLTVTMTADPAQMKRDGRDITTTSTQSGFPRHWLSEAAGYVTLTSTDSPANPTLRVAVHSAPRLASNMSAAQNRLDLTGGATGTSEITLAGVGVATAPLTSVGTVGEDFSLVTAFELQGTSPALTFPPNSLPSARSADVKYVGVMSDIEEVGTITNTTVFFGIAAHGDWSVGSASETEFDIYIDTNDSGITVDNNGAIVGAEYVLFNWNTGAQTGANSTDVFISVLVNRSNNTSTRVGFTNIVNANINTNPYNNNVMVLPVPATSLGLNPSNTTINYRVFSFHRGVTGAVDQTRTFRYNVANPGISLPDVAYIDTPGALSFDYNIPAFRSARSKGLLLLHHHNREGERDEVVRAPSNLRLSHSSISNMPAGVPANFTVTVSNTEIAMLDDVNLTVTLPSGMQFLGASIGSGVQISNTGPCSAGATPGTVNCSLGMLESGAAVDITMQVQVNPLAALSGDIQMAVDCDLDEDNTEDSSVSATPTVTYQQLLPIVQR